MPVVILIIMAGCAIIPKLPEPQQLNCPEISQNCSSQRWKGIAVDTSESYRKVADWYYVFESLKQINSPEDEWCLSFFSNNKAALTFSDGNNQRAMIVRMVRENKATLESGIGVPLDGSFGAFSFQNTKVAFSCKEDRIISSDNENRFVEPNAEGKLSLKDGYYANSNIYTADLNGNMLNNVENVGYNVTYDKFSFESHPALSPDGNVIFFASDRPNGYNGTDLWFTIKLSDGNWSTPINCGENINSSCDELTPFVTKDGKQILFSSSGHQTVGGYDIFSSDISNAFWIAAKKGDITSLKNASVFFSVAKNLREPLNTTGDELFPTSPGNIDSLLYYCSNQQESASLLFKSGGFDIFLRKKVVPVKLISKKGKKISDADLSVNEPSLDANIQEPSLKISPTYNLKGTVYNARTKETIPNAEIIVRDLKPKEKVELEKENEFEITSPSKDIFYDSFKLRADDVGKYEVKLEKDRDYEVSAQAKDFFFDSFKMRLEKDDTTNVVTKNFYIPEVLTLRINFPTDIYNSPYKFTLDSNGVETDRTWEEEIKLIAQNIILSKDKINKIVFIGHTDDVGTDSYNFKLGQNRVDFVINELIKLGVPSNLLDTRSAGELEPLQQRPNENIKLYRKRLRRVEMQKILL